MSLQTDNSKSNKSNDDRYCTPSAVMLEVEFEVRFGRTEAIGVVTSNHLQNRESDRSRSKIPFRRKQHPEHLLTVGQVRARQAEVEKSKMPKTLGISAIERP